MGKSIETLVSLGMSCQTTHQANRFAENRGIGFRKGPIDWLICPPDALVNWLDQGLADFAPHEIVRERDRAYWNRTGFWFWHGFMANGENGRELDIAATTDRELQKLAYQRDQFLDTDPDTTLFLWSNVQNNLDGDVFHEHERAHYTLTAERRTKIRARIDGLFGKSCSVHFVTRPDRCDDETKDHDEVTLLPAEPSEWKGSDVAWNDALNQLLDGKQAA